MSNLIRKLQEAKDLLQKKLITEEDFEKIKNKLLSGLESNEVTSAEDLLAHHTMISQVPIPRSKPRGVKLAAAKKKVKRYQIPSSFADLPCSGKPELIFMTSSSETMVSLSYKNAVLLGKSLDHSDMRLALEPFRPEPGYTTEEIQYNKRYTIGMISSLHMEIFRRDRQVYLQDKGSKNGTLFNGKLLQRLQPVILDEPSTLQVGQILDLVAQPLPDACGVLLTRINNYTQRQHLILWDKIGITSSEDNILSPFNGEEQTAALAIIDQKFCLLNLKLTDLSYLGQSIQPNQAIPLSRGMSFDIGETTLIVVE